MKMETKIKIRRVFGVLILIGWVFIFFLAPTLQEDLPALRDQVRMLENAYSSLDQVKYRSAHGEFQVDICVGNLDEGAVIKEELKTFLASEAFLSEFLPWAEEQMGWGESTFGEVPPYPDISIYCTLKGETEPQWQTTAMYYTEPYRSDRVLEVDGYQTWEDTYY